MSVLISMDMPTSCLDCCMPMEWCNMWIGVEDGKRSDDCPLVEIPPHGRLIAEDDAIETAWMILAGLGYRRDENPELDQAVRDVFSTAPEIEVE